MSVLWISGWSLRWLIRPLAIPGRELQHKYFLACTHNPKYGGWQEEICNTLFSLTMQIQTCKSSKQIPQPKCSSDAKSQNICIKTTNKQCCWSLKSPTWTLTPELLMNTQWRYQEQSVLSAGMPADIIANQVNQRLYNTRMLSLWCYPLVFEAEFRNPDILGVLTQRNCLMTWCESQRLSWSRLLASSVPAEVFLTVSQVSFAHNNEKLGILIPYKIMSSEMQELQKTVVGSVLIVPVTKSLQKWSLGLLIMVMLSNLCHKIRRFCLWI